MFRLFAKVRRIETLQTEISPLERVEYRSGWVRLDDYAG